MQPLHKEVSLVHWLCCLGWENYELLAACLPCWSPDTPVPFLRTRQKAASLTELASGHRGDPTWQVCQDAHWPSSERPCNWQCYLHWASSLLRTSSGTAMRWPRGRRITHVPAPDNQGRWMQTEMQASGGCLPVFFERNWNEGSDHTFLPLHRTRASKQEEIANLCWQNVALLNPRIPPSPMSLVIGHFLWKSSSGLLR